MCKKNQLKIDSNKIETIKNAEKPLASAYVYIQFYNKKGKIHLRIERSSTLVLDADLAQFPRDFLQLICSCLGIPTIQTDLWIEKAASRYQQTKQRQHG